MRKGLKNALMYVVPAFLLGTITTGWVAHAATTNVQAKLGLSTIETNGQVAAKPPKLVYGGTTYVQLYAIQQSLIKAGIPATWNGNNPNNGVFQMTVPENSMNQPHLESVVFTKGGVDPYTENNGLNDLGFITYSLPVGSDTFYTYADIENISKGSHTVKEVMYDNKGNVEGTSSDQFNSPDNQSGHSDVTKWSSEKVAAGYNLVKVYLDGNYLGYGEIFGGN